jgi:hypothetical protein
VTARKRGPKRSLACLLIACGVLSIAVVPACSAVQPEVGERLTACVDADSNPDVKVVFKDSIRPLIAGKVPGPKPCANCHYHSSGTREGLDETGFDLETLGSLRMGGRRTFDDIVVPGQPCKSAIVQKLKGTYLDARMPKGGPYWDQEQIQLMIDWIAEGATGANDE